MCRKPKTGLFEKAKVDVEGDDFREGLSAIISVKVPEPQFEGQTKSKLGTSEAKAATETIVFEKLSYYLEENKEFAAELGIRAIPTVKTFSGGEQKYSSPGMLAEVRIKELASELLN